MPPRYLVVTIDTEIDSPKWQPEFPYSLENIKAISRLQNLFNKYSVRPTYLITYEVAKDQESVNILGAILNKREAEIGAHLHPWTTPPFISERERLALSYPHRSKLEKEKLINLTQAIENSFEVKPKSYRAGRYGFDEESLGFLEDLGYWVDSSITPTMNWSFDGGPNFSAVQICQPYYLNKVLEVPLTIAVNRPFWGYNSLSPRLKAVLKRIGLAKTVWLRPSISSFKDMKWVSDLTLGEGGLVLNMMFHSNELVAGCSPYVKTEKEARGFWEKLDKITDYLVNQRKLESKTLCELLS